MNSVDTYNYIIHGITEESGETYLSIEWYGKPRPMIFTKQ
jgi:hypothetical protein